MSRVPIATRRKHTDAHDLLLRACATYLRLHGMPCTIINQRPVQDGRGVWRNPGADPGCPDLIACMPLGGRVLLVECKTGSGRLTPRQRAFMDNWRRANAYCVVARSVGDLDEVISAAQKATG